MINAFAKSRRAAWLGGALLGAAAGAATWFWAGTGQNTFTRLLLTALAAFVGVNIALYLARMIATREYQSRLLLLYEQLDPKAFLAAAEPLKNAPMNAGPRSTLLVHLANGWLYAGQPDRALEILNEIPTSPKTPETKGLVLGNQATCWLAQGNPDKAQSCMDELRRLVDSGACGKDFSAKARHTLAYLELCLAIHRGKRVNLQALEKDFETSRSPFHKLDVQYRLALAARRCGDAERCARAQEYVSNFGQKTAYPVLLREK